MKLNDPAAHFDTRHKFTGMKRLRYVVVGSGVKSLHHLFFVGTVCQQDEMRVGVSEVSMYAPA